MYAAFLLCIIKVSEVTCTGLTPTLAVRLHFQFVSTGLSEIHNLNSSMHGILAWSHATGILKVEWCPSKQSCNCYIQPVTFHYYVIVLFPVLEDDVICCYVYKLVLLMIIIMKFRVTNFSRYVVSDCLRMLTVL
jgi:hypothetical protein